MTTDSTPKSGMIRSYRPIRHKAVDYPCVLGEFHPGHHEDRDGDNFTEATAPTNELRESPVPSGGSVMSDGMAQVIALLTEIRDRLPAPPAPECGHMAPDGHGRCVHLGHDK